VGLFSLFVYGIFNDAVSSSCEKQLNSKIINEGLIEKGVEQSGLRLFSRYYHDIRLEGLRKTIKDSVKVVHVPAKVRTRQQVTSVTAQTNFLGRMILKRTLGLGFEGMD
jgi:hypothetical protein